MFYAEKAMYPSEMSGDKLRFVALNAADEMPFKREGIELPDLLQRLLQVTFPERPLAQLGGGEEFA